MDDDKKRARLVEQTRRYLESAGQPRLVMLGILSITLAAGFLASVALVHVGLVQMHWRYPLAVGVAYATFLGLLRYWLGVQALPAQLVEDPEGLLVPGAAAFGAAGIAHKLAEAETQRPQSSTGSSGGSDFSWIGDLFQGAGESPGALVVLTLIAGITTLTVSVYLVVTSPMLLAELLLDGALLAVMSRVGVPAQSPHWSRAVVRRTWIAALVSAVVFGLVGFGIERIAPGTSTLAEAWAVEQRDR